MSLRRYGPSELKWATFQREMLTGIAVRKKLFAGGPRQPFLQRALDWLLGWLGRS